MPEKKKQRPKQKQPQQPGREYKMTPRPKAEDDKHRGSGKLQNKVALITGGDSGIGRAVAIAFAKEGANISVVYSEEHKDAKDTKTGTKPTGDDERRETGLSLRAFPLCPLYLCVQSLSPFAFSLFRVFAFSNSRFLA